MSENGEIYTAGKKFTLPPAVGRDDFNLTFMIFFGELPYDVGYQKKHTRPHGGG